MVVFLCGLRQNDSKPISAKHKAFGATDSRDPSHVHTPHVRSRYFGKPAFGHDT